LVLISIAIDIAAWLALTAVWLFLLRNRLPRSLKRLILAAALGLLTTILLGIVIMALTAGRTND
jgi:hypothetical protein